MKILTVLGTRPEIIRLSLVIKKLDQQSDHVLVHTGQNYAHVLSDLFFQDLSVRKPDYWLGVRGESFGEQIGQILTESEKVLRRERPDRLLILGDTNSALVAIIAKRMGIPVYHMEAGNRCYDDRVPEEINRRVIDHSSSILLPYTHRSKENLLAEGIARERIYVIGNPIFEVLESVSGAVAASGIHARFGLERGRYMLVTMHRAENVDVEARLRSILAGLEQLSAKFGVPVVCSLHPRTSSKLEALGIPAGSAGVRFIEPPGFADFVALERDALCVISDSGTVQEECCIFKVPNVTIRDATERPETIECGSNILAGAASGRIVSAVTAVLQEGCVWSVPEEYTDAHVSSKVLRILLGYERFEQDGIAGA